MSSWQRLSTVSQLTGYLRKELADGRWSGRMPGVIRLAGELGVARNSVEAALRELEREGLLLPQGHGRGRLIDLKGSSEPASGLRLAILASDVVDRKLGYQIEIVYQLTEAGHKVVYAPRSMTELGMDVQRIARMVENSGADAWLVMAGPLEVLEWFFTLKVPVLALFGRRRGLPMAGVGPDKPTAYAAATQMLIGLGHRRIVLLARTRRRLPVPGASEQAFLDELSAHGIAANPYHLPDWEESVEGFHTRLESLFLLTPPTALIIDEAPLFAATQQFLAGRRLRVPEDVSLVCTDADPTFEWCRPTIAHIRWDSRPVVRRIVRWAENLNRDKEDVRQTLTPAEFVVGGTIGPVKG